MSTLATADLGSSDDEADANYTPSLPKPRKAKLKVKRPRPTSGSGSGSGSNDDSESSASSGEDAPLEDGEAQRLRLEQETLEAAERRRKVQEEFAKMRDESIAGPSSKPSPPPTREVEMVEVKRARRFAGETIYETVSLPATDPEAIAYLDTRKTIVPVEAPKPSTDEPPAGPVSSSTSHPTSSTKSTLSGKPPIRKKPRQSLEQMANALSKGKKMTTLEKSQMDWKSHTKSNADLSDELEANRRSGGLLANKEFLNRVGERRAEGPGHR